MGDHFLDTKGRELRDLACSLGKVYSGTDITVEFRFDIGRRINDRVLRVQRLRIMKNLIEGSIHSVHG